MTIEIEVTHVPPITLEVATVGTQGPAGSGGGGSTAWADITGKPTTFAPSAHDHNSLYYTEAEITTFLAAKSNTGHTHAISDVTNLQSTLDAKANGSDAVNVTGNQTIDGVKTFTSSPTVPDGSFTINKTTGLQSALDSKSAPGHTHVISDTTGLQTALDGKAATSHTHTIANITSLQTTLDAKALDSAVVKLTGNQTVAGVKTFSSSPVVPDASFTIAKVIDLQATLDSMSGGTGPHDHNTLYYTETEVNTLLSGKADTSHTHIIANVSGLQTAFDSKAASATTMTITTDQTVDGIKTFSSSPIVPNDSFSIGKVIGLQAALDGKAASGHTHTEYIDNTELRADWGVLPTMHINTTTGVWPSRTVPSGYTGPVTWDSLGYVAASDPSGAVTGDRWLRRT
jgi:hypothetical protein